MALMSLLEASIGKVMYLSVNSKQDGQCLTGNKILQQGKQFGRSVYTDKFICHKFMFSLFLVPVLPQDHK